MGKTLRDLFAGTPVDNPTLQEVVGQDDRVVSPRNEAEDVIGALMPGDPVEEHILYTEPNPYLYRPYSKLKAMLEDPEVAGDERVLVSQALRYQQVSHGGEIEQPRPGEHDPRPKRHFEPAFKPAGWESDWTPEVPEAIPEEDLENVEVPENFNLEDLWSTR